MKKILFFILLSIALVSCKNDTKKDSEESTISDNSERTAKQSDGLTLLKGDFVYYDGAAVLQTHADIYGVFITDKTKELNKLVEQYKKAATDMVPVEIRGKITNKKDEVILWENKVEIIEILNVYEPKDNDDVVKLGS